MRKIVPEKFQRKMPSFSTEKDIKDYYKRLEKVELDDGSILIGAIINEDNEKVKINTTNGLITVPKNSVVSSKMIWKKGR